MKKCQEFWKIQKEKTDKTEFWWRNQYINESTLWREQFKKENNKKVSKKVKKLLKKVLTNGDIYDILHERSTEERKKQRSLKIEQQQIRTN